MATSCRHVVNKLTIISIVINRFVMTENPGSRLADVSRLMRRNFDARARSIGVTRPQWQVLSLLNRNEGINQGRLADLLEVEPITVCRMVDRLQDAALVERRTDPADRRSWRLFLTEKAHVLLGQLRPLADEMIAQAFDGVDDQDRARLMATLDRVRQNLSRRAPEPMVSNG
jgi:DNA-binding MarR family transcriptional regulator